MRLEFVRRRREEEDELRRSAPELEEEELEEEEEYDLPGWGSSSSRGNRRGFDGTEMSSQVMHEEDVEGVEEFVRDEQEEMRALLENLPDDGELEVEMDEQGSQSQGSESLWSDGADHDALFDEVLLSQGHQPPEAQFGGDGEEMDMS